MFKKVAIIVVIVIISGLSGIIADRYLFPYLSMTEFFSKNKLLKKATEDVTVINKTEQVYVKEDTSVTKIASEVASSVVNIISYPNPDAKIAKNSANSNSAIKNGTGLIATSDGIILTYASAINPDNSKYKVMLFDGNNYDAELLGVDSYSNLAFLKITASNLPAVSFGNSDEFKAGEKIIAVGNDLNSYQNIYASGILNSFDPYYNLAGKTVSSSEKLEGVFQSNISDEKSYVGGPIVDYSGQVIGVIGSIEKDGQLDFFQIPGNKVKTALDKAIKKDLANNYQLGIYYIPVSKTYALVNNLSVDKGALVYAPSGQQGLAVIAGTPAAAAGIKIGDIITKVNSEEVSSENSLPRLLYKYHKGDTVELTILRDGTETKIQVKL